jgi:hypothetical protein
MTDSSVETSSVHGQLVLAIAALRQAIVQLRMACAAEASVLGLDFVLEADVDQRPSA